MVTPSASDASFALYIQRETCTIIILLAFNVGVFISLCPLVDQGFRKKSLSFICPFLADSPHTLVSIGKTDQATHQYILFCANLSQAWEEVPRTLG